MNKMFKLFALIGVLLVVISCHSCGKDDPLPPTPPEKPIRFSTEQVDLTLENNSTSVTLENFKGTLTQDGQVTGFKVTITGNIIRITAEQYIPGDYTFIFKGNGKSYPLKVRLQKMPEMRLTGVFTSAGEELLPARFTSKKFDQGRVSRFLVSGNRDNPKEQYVLISDLNISGKEVPLLSRLMEFRKCLMERVICQMVNSVVSRALLFQRQERQSLGFMPS